LKLDSLYFSQTDNLCKIEEKLESKSNYALLKKPIISYESNTSYNAETKGDSTPEFEIYVSLMKATGKSINPESKGCTMILPTIVRVFPIIVNY